MKEPTAKSACSIAIITGGILPVPASKGGAVESLVEMLCTQNERNKEVILTVFSIDDAASSDVEDLSTYTHYCYTHVPRLIQMCDFLIGKFSEKIMHKKNVMSYRYFMQRLWFLFDVKNRLAQSQFDYLILENSALPLKCLHGKNARYLNKCYLHMHNVLSHTFGTSKELTKVKGFLSVSHYISQNILDSVPSLSPKKCHVLHNAVDISRFCTTDAAKQADILRTKLGIKKDDVVFLSTGRLTEEKGALQLLNAFINADLKKAKLVIAGGFFFDSDIKTPFEEKLRKLAQQMSDRIIFTGFLPYDQMPIIYALADVCCVPSIWDDPAPLAVIESLAAGKPLITTYSGGIPEYADESCALILQRNENLTQNLSNAMKKLYTDEALRMRMGMSGREKAVALYSPEKMYENFVSFFNKE